MKKRLTSMFFATYILLGILGFFLVTFVGSHLLEARLEKSITSDIYQTAHRIAESDLVRHNITSTNVESVQNTLSLAANYPDTIIWIINSNGQIILSTRKDISPDHPIDLDGFDPASWGSNYYQIGDFYGYFHDSRLSTIAPITEHLNIRGYVAVHYLMSDLYQSRSSLLWIIQLLFVITYLMTAVLFLFYSFYIRKPLYAITKGASEFANGNLSYQIPVKSENELGYLASNLNYMADKLNRNGEYQRQFISNISHDFRSPLTSIKGYVEAMIDGTIPVEMQEKYLKIISYEAERLEKLTRGLLTLNELDIHKRMLNIQDFDINQTIKSTAASFEGTCTTRQILLELILSGQTLYAHADLEQIQQVLYNLLSNAIKFSPDHSTITIETTEKNGKIFVSVKDHGIGIPKSSLNRIWERFYKIDRSRGKDQKGTGLGLAIVKEIISAHGQHINVISTEGVGTEFIFTLEQAK
ncbi:HAMP domain-containing histidine kinase [Blautia glucerasea]|jgi:signal transduction histidine kinase|uniref:sensor histidine kinase n=1 Tax=Blautia TaxID=572511 RepID=UPI00156EAC72|nr:MULTISPECIES: HAMP domain-containing sensor histidine kinase [Blautia]MCB5550047.1 HAMP domain-containing histidine kinase [Blautia sp. MSK17_66]MCB6370433.1 HAMP domain-containing histidine kinase [Blautia glucerasea]NSK01724.1 HAMP domain-containing histidine kinase [Blautia obeum]